MSASKNPELLEMCYYRRFEADEEINVFPFYESEHVSNSIIDRVGRRILENWGCQPANDELLRLVDETNPDVVLIFKGGGILPETLRQIRRQGVVLVNYNADHPFEHYSRGTGNRRIIDSLELYDLHITYSRRIARQLAERTPPVGVVVVPFGHDLADDQFSDLQGVSEISDRLAMIGNPDEKRAKLVSRLVDAGVPMDVYGFRWERYLKPGKRLRINCQVVGVEMYRTLRRYRAQLNVLRPHNVESHNMRSFEVPACGGIMLAEDSREHRLFFEDGREAVLFSNDLDMVEKAKGLLAMSAESASEIRKAARRRCVESGYSYADRARQVASFIKQLPDERMPIEGN